MDSRMMRKEVNNADSGVEKCGFGDLKSQKIRIFAAKATKNEDFCHRNELR